MNFRRPRPAAQPTASKPKNPVNSPEQGISYALRLLGARDYTREEMRRKLLRKGLEDAAAEGVLREVESRGLVDDQRYARRLASYWTHEKLWGPQRVLQKLREKGIPRESAWALAQEAAQEGSSRERLRKVIGSKLRGRSLEEISPTERKRMANSLFRRGFLWDDIIEILGEGGGFTEE